MAVNESITEGVIVVGARETSTGSAEYTTLKVPAVSASHDAATLKRLFQSDDHMLADTLEGLEQLKSGQGRKVSRKS